jgi:hypothetical protein
LKRTQSAARFFDMRMCACIAGTDQLHQEPDLKRGLRSKLFAYFHTKGADMKGSLLPVTAQLFALLPLQANVLDVGIGSAPHVWFYKLRVRS